MDSGSGRAPEQARPEPVERPQSEFPAPVSNWGPLRIPPRKAERKTPLIPALLNRQKSPDSFDVKTNKNGLKDKKQFFLKENQQNQDGRFPGCEN